MTKHTPIITVVYICVSPVKFYGNTLVRNSCNGSRVKPLTVWGNKKARIWSLLKQEAWTKCLLPVQVLVTVLSFVFRMLEMKALKHMYEKILWWAGDLVVINLLQHHVHKHGSVQLGCETRTRDSHVPLLTLVDCDHYIFLHLSINCFHVWRIFFRAEFLQLKEEINENIQSSFPFFRDTSTKSVGVSVDGELGQARTGQGCSAPECLLGFFSSTIDTRTASNLTYILHPTTVNIPKEDRLDLCFLKQPALRAVLLERTDITLQSNSPDTFFHSLYWHCAAYISCLISFTT